MPREETRGTCFPRERQNGQHDSSWMLGRAIGITLYFRLLGMPSISSRFPIPHVQNASDDDGRALEATTEKRFTRFASELEWYAEALRDRRARDVPY